jgi:hypothetical protein
LPNASTTMNSGTNVSARDERKLCIQLPHYNPFSVAKTGIMVQL